MSPVISGGGGKALIRRHQVPQPSVTHARTHEANRTCQIQPDNPRSTSDRCKTLDGRSEIFHSPGTSIDSRIQAQTCNARAPVHLRPRLVTFVRIARDLTRNSGSYISMYNHQCPSRKPGFYVFAQTLRSLMTDTGSGNPASRSVCRGSVGNGACQYVDPVWRIDLELRRPASLYLEKAIFRGIGTAAN